MCVILVKSSFLGLILSKPSSRRSSVMSKLVKTSHTLKKRCSTSGIIYCTKYWLPYTAICLSTSFLVCASVWISSIVRAPFLVSSTDQVPGM